MIARLLRRDLLKVYPQLHDVRVDYAWGGLMSYARHKMPQIGRSADGVWYAVGFGGHGMAPTTVSGELLAAAIAGERPVPEAIRVVRSDARLRRARSRGRATDLHRHADTRRVRRAPPPAV